MLNWFLWRSISMMWSPRCFVQLWAFACTLRRNRWIPNKLSKFFPRTWVALQRLLCVLCGSLEITWCRPRTWRCTTIVQTCFHQLWPDWMVLRKEGMEGPMSWNLTVTLIGPAATSPDVQQVLGRSSWMAVAFTATAESKPQFFFLQCRLRSLLRRACW